MTGAGAASALAIQAVLNNKNVAFTGVTSESLGGRVRVKRRRQSLPLASTLPQREDLSRYFGVFADDREPRLQKKRSYLGLPVQFHRVQRPHAMRRSHRLPGTFHVLPLRRGSFASLTP